MVAGMKKSAMESMFLEAQDLYDAGRLRRAARIWEELGEAGDADAYFNAGNCNAQLGRRKRARRDLLRAAHMGVCEAWWNVGLLVSDEQPTAAVRYFSTAIAHGDLKGYVGASVALHQMGHSREAIHLLEHAVDHHVPGSFAALGVALYDALDDHPDNEARIAELVSQEPDGHPRGRDVLARITPEE